jgi:hypothetical protein
MIANGMISETLDPISEMVKLLLLLSLEEMTDLEKREIIKEINKNMKEEHKRRIERKKIEMLL